jgi:hypothetical protein
LWRNTGPTGAGKSSFARYSRSANMPHRSTGGRAAGCSGSCRRDRPFAARDVVRSLRDRTASTGQVAQIEWDSKRATDSVTAGGLAGKSKKVAEPVFSAGPRAQATLKSSWNFAGSRLRRRIPVIHFDTAFLPDNMRRRRIAYNLHAPSQGPEYEICPTFWIRGALWTVKQGP